MLFVLGRRCFLVSVLIVRMFDLKSCDLGVNYCIGDHRIIFVVFHVGADDRPHRIHDVSIHDDFLSVLILIV